MGSRRKQTLSDMEICRLYAAGFSRTEIGWRSSLYDKEVMAVLQANGVRLRSSGESAAMARSRRLERERLRASKA